jgi:ketosteroid isomerase-like protein
MENVENTVIATVEKMTEAFHAADMDGVMRAYEDRPTIVFAPGQPVSDPAILRSTFEQWFALSPQFTFSAHEVFVAGDLALHLTPWQMKGTAPDGTAISQSGLSVAVLRRQNSGEWKIAIDDPFGQHLLEAREPQAAAAGSQRA